MITKEEQIKNIDRTIEKFNNAILDLTMYTESIVDIDNVLAEEKINSNTSTDEFLFAYISKSKVSIHDKCEMFFTTNISGLYSTLIKF
jgi:hypothetical protein